MLRVELCTLKRIDRINQFSLLNFEFSKVQLNLLEYGKLDRRIVLISILNKSSELGHVMLQLRLPCTYLHGLFDFGVVECMLVVSANPIFVN